MKRILGLFLIGLLMASLTIVPTFAAPNPYTQFSGKAGNISDLQGNRAMSVKDITGNGVPELIYVTKTRMRNQFTGEYQDSGEVHILQLRSEGLSEILSQVVNFGPREEGDSRVQVGASRNSIVICTGYEFGGTTQREYTWYHYNGTEMTKGETLAYLKVNDSVRFFYGKDIELDTSSRLEISESQYYIYLDKIKAMGEDPLISIKGKDGKVITTDTDQGMTVSEVKNYFNGLAKSFTGFIDVPSNAWYLNSMKYVVQNGLMKGTSAYYFSPNSTTTRAQAVMILYRLAGSPSSKGSSFSDVRSSDWYYKAVSWASLKGIASGYGNGRFGPNDTLNRQQLATMLYRYAQYKRYNTDASGTIYGFPDVGSVSSYAKQPMTWAVSKGLISGTDSGRLEPNGKATRAQLATILQRFNTNLR